MSRLTLPDGAAIAESEQKKIADALEALSKDSHAPRQLSVSVTLHLHNEYPKHLYRGKDLVVVNDADEEAKAEAAGYGKFIPPTEDAAE
jgi:hypothetical protein